MGTGKGGEEDAAQPVVLKMELHCAGCAQKVKKAIKHFPGVESVVADAAANRVVVAGTADAAALKTRIEAKTKKAVEIVSAGSAPKRAAAEPKDGGAGEKKADKDGGAGEKKGDKGANPKEEKEKKQPPEEKKPKEETVLLKIRLHCDGCADRIRRRIYKIKGVKDVVLDGNAKDEVKVTGTMDVPAMLAYLKEKLNRAVEAVAPGKKEGSGEGKDDRKDKDGDGDKNKNAAAGGDGKKDKGKGIDAAGPSTAAAAAFIAPAPAEASTYHVTPPYGYVAYPQGPVPTGYSYPYYGSADGMGHANPSAATDYHQVQHHHPDASQHQPYAPYPYRFDMAPAPQLFSDENPNACSVM
ncbi:heavy metal-associated isoprenylated plant protein 6-like [Phragmites australis]|uniref:heavy metal-associated isoprenylated plant protein 6-like n=1 Tax=Phragmites australis TaxID=29695 RepID=UPI002D773A4A|nr:heavy metal-associated isoprenylated plant protein 6-like [Phragmites australis]